MLVRQFTLAGGSTPSIQTTSLSNIFDTGFGNRVAPRQLRCRIFFIPDLETGWCVPNGVPNPRRGKAGFEVWVFSKGGLVDVNMLQTVTILFGLATCKLL